MSPDASPNARRSNLTPHYCVVGRDLSLPSGIVTSPCSVLNNLLVLTLQQGARKLSGKLEVRCRHAPSHTSPSKMHADDSRRLRLCSR